MDHEKGWEAYGDSERAGRILVGVRSKGLKMICEKILKRVSIKEALRHDYMSKKYRSIGPILSHPELTINRS